MHDLATWIPRLGTVLLDFVWQGALIGLLAWLALALLRNARPQARYAVACAALLACLLVPSVQLAGGPSTTAASTAATPDDGASRLVATASVLPEAPLDLHPSRSRALALPRPPEAALPWIVAAWIAGVAAFALRMAGGLLWVVRLRRGTTPADPAWQARLDALAARLGLHRAVALRLLASGDSPLSAGWWRPVVLVPAALVLRMPTPLLEALLAHELAHIRRHDYVVNLLQGVVETLLFYHPVTWWLSRRIRIEREEVADAIAADLIGAPRRLAVALSELERFTCPPTFAQAAHGGLLMSRIRQLVRPERRAAGSGVVLPVIGLLAAAIALHAHARGDGATSPAAGVSTAAASTSTRPATSAPVTRPATTTRAVAAKSTAREGRPVTRIVSRGTDNTGYALVRAGEPGFSLSGDLDDVEAIRATRASIDGDFLWFRRDGKAWVVRDADTLARADAAWAPTRALESDMQAASDRMAPHSRRLEALGARMEALSSGADDDGALREASTRMETLGREQGELGRQQAALALQLATADDARRGELERAMTALGDRQQALSDRMQAESTVMEAHSAPMAERHAPMEKLGLEMEAASRPMEAIGKDLEVLGTRMERQVAIADRQVRGLIDDAVARGLATPAPSSSRD